MSQAIWTLERRIIEGYTTQNSICLFGQVFHSGVILSDQRILSDATWSLESLIEHWGSEMSKVPEGSMIGINRESQFCAATYERWAQWAHEHKLGFEYAAANHLIGISAFVPKFYFLLIPQALEQSAKQILFPPDR